jgi:hypothetical protein
VRDAARVLSGHSGRYFFISTISVYAANDKPADETAARGLQGQLCHGRDNRVAERQPKALGPLKARSETEARTQYGEAGTTIIRRSLIVGGAITPTASPIGS